MYPLLECLAIAAVVLVFGGGLFIAISIYVLVEALVTAVRKKSQALISRAMLLTREKLEPQAQAVGHSN